MEVFNFIKKIVFIIAVNILNDERTANLECTARERIKYYSWENVQFISEKENERKPKRKIINAYETLHGK